MDVSYRGEMINELKNGFSPTLFHGRIKDLLRFIILLKCQLSFFFLGEYWRAKNTHNCNGVIRYLYKVKRHQSHRFRCINRKTVYRNAFSRKPPIDLGNGLLVIITIRIMFSSNKIVRFVTGA
jgi:hypothetical protein